MRNKRDKSPAPLLSRKGAHVSIELLREKASQYDMDNFIKLVRFPVLVGKGVYQGNLSPPKDEGATFLIQVEKLKINEILEKIIFLIYSESLDLSNKMSCKLGSSSENDIVIQEKTISKHHAVFLLEDGEAYIYDSGSSNGSFINGMELKHREIAQLNDEDEIRIGRFAFTFLTPKSLYKNMTKGSLPKSLIEITVAGRLEYAPLKLMAEQKTKEEFAQFIGKPVFVGAALLRGQAKPTVTKEGENTTMMIQAETESQDKNDKTSVHVPEKKAWLRIPLLEKTIFCVYDKEVKKLAGPFTTITLGRFETNDMIMEDNSISKFHADLKCTEWTYYMRDRNSSNGTAINNKPCSDEYVELKVNDRVRFGRIQFKFTSPEELFDQLRKN